MSKDACKAAVRRLWNEGFNQGNLALLDELCDTRLVAHDMGAPDAPAGPAGMRVLMQSYRRLLSDAHVHLDEVLGQEATVVAHWSAEGLALAGMAVYRFEAGKIVETWSGLDVPGLLLSAV